MQQVQVFRLSEAEYGKLKKRPFAFSIAIPASLSPGKMDFEVGLSNDRAVALAPSGKQAKRKAAAEGLKCDECGATTSATGKPLSALGLSAHRFKAHGIFKNGKKRRRKAGAK